MGRLQADPFLSELTSMFERSTEKGSVWVQGRERLYVKYIAEQLGLDGSYVSHTYIEQIWLEKRVNDVMALLDNLKSKLSIDDDMVSSLKEALSRASTDQRSRFLNRCLLGIFQQCKCIWPNKQKSQVNYDDLKYGDLL